MTFTVSVSIITVSVREGLNWFLLIVLNLLFFDFTFLQLLIIMLSRLGSFDHSLSQFNLNRSSSGHHWAVMNPKWEIWELYIIIVVRCNLIPWFIIMCEVLLCVCIGKSWDFLSFFFCVCVFWGILRTLVLFLSYGWKLYTALKLKSFLYFPSKFALFPIFNAFSFPLLIIGKIWRKLR